MPRFVGPSMVFRCWMRTIWLTGPYALTIAFHNYTQNANARPSQNIQLGNRRVLDFTTKPKACSTSREVNEEMNTGSLKYTNIPDDTPFLVKRQVIQWRSSS